MHFAVMKLSFEADTSIRSQDADRELKNLAEKVRARFKVSAAAILDDASGLPGIAVAALGSNSEKLSQTLDAIVSFCEQAGLGRIDHEDSILDDIDAIADYQQQ